MEYERYRRPRQRFVGAAGVVGAMAGAALAGQTMIWCGYFKPGVTPNGVILDYWPGFLVGAIGVGLLASLAARFLWSAMRG